MIELGMIILIIFTIYELKMLDRHDREIERLMDEFPGIREEMKYDKR